MGAEIIFHPAVFLAFILLVFGAVIGITTMSMRQTGRQDRLRAIRRELARREQNITDKDINP